MANHQQFLSVENFRSYSDAKVLRIAPDVWCLRKAPNAESAVFSVDVCPQYNTAANGGYKLISFDVVYAVSGAALTAAPTEVLSTLSFVDSKAPTVTKFAIGGSAYKTTLNATTGQTYVVNRTITSPVLINSGTSKTSIEFVFPCDTNTLLDIYGINLRYNTANA